MLYDYFTCVNIIIIYFGCIINNVDDANIYF